MFIRSLELKDYRNYNGLAMEFDEKINILFGNNAQGKTNILEALYLGSTTKSHRGSKDREMIQMGKEESHIRIYMDRDGITHKIDLHLKKNKPKGAAIDGVPIRKSGELIGFMKVVFFSPEDLSMIKNGPGERRRFLDMELCQLDKVYLSNLYSYNRIIHQRNNLLKQISFNPSLLDTLQVWDEQLADYGGRIMERRTSFVKQLNSIVFDIHRQLSGGKETLVIRYEPNVPQDQYGEKLLLSRDRDIAMKMTNYGPHRDDLIFEINGADVRKFGSQGQQRTAALSLKMAEIELVKKIAGHRPILLLDDVLSELDRSRQNYLLNGIKDIQVIMTCTGMEEFIRNRVPVNKVYQVVNGTVVFQQEKEEQNEFRSK